MINAALLGFRWFGVCAVLAVPFGAAAQPNAHLPRLPDQPGGYASTHIIVKMQPDSNWPAAAGGHASHGPHNRFDATCARWGVTQVAPALRTRCANARLAARFGLDRTFRLEVPPGTDAVAMAEEFHALGIVETAEVDGIGTVAGFVPDDTLFSSQWNMHNTGQTAGGIDDADIDAPEAWALHTGDEGTVTVAIIDSGVDPHDDFDGRLLVGTNTNDPAFPDLTTDDCPHGTHVAGIVAAEGNNGTGVAGISWGANILPVRVLFTNNPCSGFESHAADGIIWAVDNGADICNLSLQYRNGSQFFEDAVNYAFEMGVLLVAAAGNGGFCEDNNEVVCFPARFENCMAVSATNSADSLYVLSNFGNEIDVSAPGANIRSTWIGPPTNPYTNLSGTSMAAPHVSGLAALLKSAHPGLTNVALRNIISYSADDLGDVGWDPMYGHGRINAHQAMLLAEETIWVVESDPPDGAVDARQPSDPDGQNAAGWDRVRLTFSGGVAGLTTADFAVSSTAVTASVPEVVDVIPESFDTVQVVLSDAIPVGEWTTISHPFTGTGVTLGYLPGDVNGDHMSTPADILAVIDALNGIIELPEWQTDIDRSDETAPPDILRVVDLLNGAGVYEPFLDRSLPE